MPITPLFAAIFALAYVYLSISVVKLRFSEKIVLGVETKDNVVSAPMLKAVRIHANFIEYVPMALILFWFLEIVTSSSAMVFWLACILLVARVAHVIGMNNPKRYLLCRQCGVVATFGVISFSAIKLIWSYLPVTI